MHSCRSLHRRGARCSGASTQKVNEGVYDDTRVFVQTWGPLLRRFLRSEDDQVELLLTFEEYCSQEGVFEGDGKQGSAFEAIFVQVRWVVIGAAEGLCYHFYFPGNSSVRV